MAIGLDSLGMKKAVERLLDDAYDAAKSAFIAVNEESKILLKSGVNSYIKRESRDITQVKTLVIPDRSLPIEEIYVSPFFRESDEIIDENELIKNLNNKTRFIVTGIAGQGKSMFMRWLFDYYCTINYGVIPIFVELRALEGGGSIEDYIIKKLAGFDEDPKKMQHFKNILRNAKFLILLDGLDEIPQSLRDAIKAQIDELSVKYVNSGIVLSSRPSSTFVEWRRFSVISIQKYDVNQAREVINRIPVNKIVKEAFNKKLDNNLFIQKYEGFLENPLLIGMIFLTFWKNNYIPEKEHLIYEKSFETFYLLHDGTKFLYNRKLHSGLAEDDFRKFWQTFNFFAYLQAKLRFSELDFKNIVDKCNRTNSLSVNYRMYLNDMIESICMIKPDGDKYTYLHRSYQEYYCAKHFIYNNGMSYVDALAKCGVRFEDKVVEFCKLIDKDIFEFNYERLCLLKILNYLEDNSITDSREIFSLFYLKVSADLYFDDQEDSEDVGSKYRCSFTIASGKSHAILFPYYNIISDDLHQYRSDLNEKLVGWVRKNGLESGSGANQYYIDVNHLMTIDVSGSVFENICK